MRGNWLTRMFTGPVGPVGLFTGPKLAVLGNFYWPGDSGSLLASSPGSGKDFNVYTHHKKLVTLL